jgi:endonuclease-3 related protein
VESSLPDRLTTVYERLLAAYGPQGWWPGSGDPFEIVVGAVLTQSVSWKNVERALANLRAAGALGLPEMQRLEDATLETLLRPSGYYTVKARRLRAFLQLVERSFGGDLGRLLALPLPQLRATLLATHGIGEETADAIVVYAAAQPSFAAHLPADATLFGEYHALIVRHGIVRCRKRDPRCLDCPLLQLCPTGARLTATSPAAG